MAQPNVNREPTMEEILASIRRIIENNDSAEERQPQAEPGGTGEPQRELEDEVARTNDAARESFVAPASRSGAGPVSLAEVAARVRASGSSAALVRPSGPVLAPAAVHGNAAVRLDEEPDLDDSGDETAAPAQPEPVEAAEADASGPPPAANLGSGEEVAAGAEAADDEEDMSEEEAVLKSELESVLETAETALPTSGPDAPEPTEPKFDASNGRRESDRAVHLISASAGAKVAAAFGDLNDAFAAGPRRSFDEIAEEMLRPMLQQWLDDNLPTLVERLVREEIERVARGGHR